MQLQDKSCDQNKKILEIQTLTFNSEFQAQQIKAIVILLKGYIQYEPSVSDILARQIEFQKSVNPQYEKYVQDEVARETAVLLEGSQLNIDDLASRICTLQGKTQEEHELRNSILQLSQLKQTTCSVRSTLGEAAQFQRWELRSINQLPVLVKTLVQQQRKIRKQVTEKLRLLDKCYKVIQQRKDPQDNIEKEVQQLLMDASQNLDLVLIEYIKNSHKLLQDEYQLSLGNCIISAFLSLLELIQDDTAILVNKKYKLVIQQDSEQYPAENKFDLLNFIERLNKSINTSTQNKSEPLQQDIQHTPSKLTIINQQNLQNCINQAPKDKSNPKGNNCSKNGIDKGSPVKKEEGVDVVVLKLSQEQAKSTKKEQVPQGFKSQKDLLKSQNLMQRFAKKLQPHKLDMQEVEQTEKRIQEEQYNTVHFMDQIFYAYQNKSTQSENFEKIQQEYFKHNQSQARLFQHIIGAPPDYAKSRAQCNDSYQYALKCFGHLSKQDLMSIPRYPRKYICFDKDRRPPFYGSCTQQRCYVPSRNPLFQIIDIDYEVDSDDEWEEEPEGESLSDKEDDEALEAANSVNSDMTEFVVSDGYLSDDERAFDDDNHGTIDNNNTSNNVNNLNSNYNISQQKIAKQKAIIQDWERNTGQQNQCLEFRQLDQKILKAKKTNKPFAMNLKDVYEDVDLSDNLHCNGLTIFKSLQYIIQDHAFTSIQPPTEAELQDQNSRGIATIDQSELQRQLEKDLTTYLNQSDFQVLKKKEMIVESFMKTQEHKMIVQHNQYAPTQNQQSLKKQQPQVKYRKSQIMKGLKEVAQYDSSSMAWLTQERAIQQKSYFDKIRQEILQEAPKENNTPCTQNAKNQIQKEPQLNISDNVPQKRQYEDKAHNLQEVQNNPQNQTKINKIETFFRQNSNSCQNIFQSSSLLRSQQNNKNQLNNQIHRIKDFRSPKIGNIQKSQEDIGNIAFQRDLDDQHVNHDAQQNSLDNNNIKLTQSNSLQIDVTQYNTKEIYQKQPFYSNSIAKQYIQEYLYQQQQQS